MPYNFVILRLNVQVKDALALMVSHKITGVPIIDDGNIVGNVSLNDIRRLGRVASDTELAVSPVTVVVDWLSAQESL